MASTPYYTKAESDALNEAIKRQFEISFVTYNTYALMIEASTPTMVTVVRVLVDEDKGLNNTEYRLFTDGTRMWIANTIDN